MDLIEVGYGNYVSSGRVIAVVNPESSPIKRTIQEAREERRLIDATFGKKTKAVIITDSDHLILTAMETEALMQRFGERQETGAEGGEEE